ncbi:helix-turn-helix domain-containing protein [Methylobacterium sp. J-068]|uniref:helix-turn-helix domain-containing protein n=1 Tax=Methylobacterium sp. J-068 TaxID=2836649 RepID=UPI001FBA95A2|nr:helix-turn-helix domain-containing protein [Methylobacterium sp. J-068]MCJ2035487.1 helix-turn-helix domain-containing protein [Methylobacterium sp. J-068]
MAERPPGKPYPRAIRDRAAAMRAEGATAEVVGVAIGVHIDTIHRWNGATLRGDLARKRAEALAHLAEGVSVRETARKVGCTPRSVMRWRDEGEA